MSLKRGIFVVQVPKMILDVLGNTTSYRRIVIVSDCHHIVFTHSFDGPPINTLFGCWPLDNGEFPCEKCRLPAT